jgi:multiple antibiotic resistance protein
MMYASVTLFVSTFTTMLAIINPLEAMPIFLGLTASKTAPERIAVARRSCLYALALMIFFLVFGTLLLRIFGVPLPMVRIVGGIVLMKIGFELFSPSPGGSLVAPNSGDTQTDIAFVPLAMPIMFGPGAIATVLGMTSLVRQVQFAIGPMTAIFAAMPTTMFATYLCLARSDVIQKHVGPMGIDAATRIVGFFVAAMGVALIFDGIKEALQTMSPGSS